MENENEAAMSAEDAELFAAAEPIATSMQESHNYLVTHQKNHTTTSAILTTVAFELGKLVLVMQKMAKAIDERFDSEGSVPR